MTLRDDNARYDGISSGDYDVSRQVDRTAQQIRSSEYLVMSLRVLLVQRNEKEHAAILLVFSEQYHMRMHLNLRSFRYVDDRSIMKAIRCGSDAR
jgi:hypothetical protein